MMTDATPRSLAESMQPVVSAIGFDAALQLVARCGGIRVMIPAEPNARDVISQVVGVAAAQRLAEHIGRGLLDVPRCLNWLLMRRNDEMRARYEHGETQAELALRFSLTERHVRRILLGEDAPSPSPTPDLFPDEGAHT